MESLRSIAARTSKYTYQVISKSRNICGRTDLVKRNLRIVHGMAVRVMADTTGLIVNRDPQAELEDLHRGRTWADQPARRNVSGTRRRLLWLRSPLVAETRCHWMIAPV